MKIAITGHSAGIGKSFATYLHERGHQIVGLSRRNGFNIKSMDKAARQIADSDLFINNAQSGYSQTDLLYEVWHMWEGQQGKWIWNIGTLMTEFTNIPELPGQSPRHLMEYKNQKFALETATQMLQTSCIWPKIVIIRPGSVATLPDQRVEFPNADPDEWAKTVVDLILLASERNLNITELGLGCTRQRVIV